MSYNKYSLDLENSNNQYSYVSAFAHLDGLSAFTIEFWLKAESIASNRGFMGRSDGSTKNQFTIGQDGSGVNALQVSIANSTSDWFGNYGRADSNSLEVGVWHHYAIVFDGSLSGNSNRLKFYKNGVQMTSTTYNGTIPATLTTPSAQQFHIGRRGSGETSSGTDGLMSNVRVWSDARTQSEIQDNMYKILTGTANNLVGSWYNDVNDHNDDAGINNLTASGSPVFSTIVPWTGANNTDWSDPLEIQSDNTKVSGASDLTDFPVLIKDDNLTSEVYAGLNIGSQADLAGFSGEAYYKFLTGALTTDDSGNSRTLTNNNSVAETTDFFGNGADFGDQSGSLKSFSRADGLGLDLNSNWTFAFPLSVNVAPATDEQFYLIDIRSTTGTARYLLIKYRDSSGTKRLEVNAGGTTITFDVDFSTDEKHHYSITKSGSTVTLYLDGNPVASGSMGSTANAINKTVIGAATNLTSQNSKVKMGEIFIDNTALSASDIKKIGSPGSDLRITTDSAGTTEVPFEIKSLDIAAKTCEIWAKVPSLLYATATSLFNWYGNPDAIPYDITDTYGSKNVWADNYQTVLHFNENPGGSAPQLYCSAEGINKGTTSGSMVSGDLVDGEIGKGWDFDGIDDEVNITAGTAYPQRDLTLSVWARGRTTGGGNAVVYIGDGPASNGYGLFLGTSGSLGSPNDQSSIIGLIAAVAWKNSFNSYDTTAEHLYSMRIVANGASNIDFYLYEDGVEVLSSINSSAAPTPGTKLQIADETGAYAGFLDGLISELKVSKVDLNADWFLTEFNNQSSPSTFWTEAGVLIDADRDSELTGSLAIDEEHDSELTGAESVNSERSSELTGSQSINSEISSETNVVNSSERGSEISGAGVFDERNSEVSVKELITPEISSELTGSQAISDEVDSETTGALAISDEINSEVNAKEVVVDERASELVGSQEISSEINSELSGSESVSDEVDSEVAGAQDLTGEINSELTGVAAFNERNSEMYVGAGIDGEITSQLYGIGSAERPLNYRIIVKDADGVKLGEVDNFRTVSFGKRVNNYGEANFDMDINDPKASYLINERVNTIEIYRELNNSSVLVWSGEQAVADGRLDEKGNNWVEVKSYTWLEQMLHRLTEEYDDYTGIDAAQVINTLFANTQAKTDGDLGITEGTIGTTYNADIIFQNDFIYDAVLSLLDTGIDLEITDAKVLNVDVIIGEDKSDEVILEYGKNIKNMRIIRDFSKPVNDVSILGEVLGEDSLQRVQVVDTGLRSTYKLRENKINQLEPSILAIFEDKGQSLINKRGLSLIRVEFELIKNLAPSIDQFTIGDGIRLIVKNGMYDIDEQYRVFEYKITFDSKNTEKLELVLGKFITI